MARKFTALIAALALGGGIANAEDKKLDERPSTERGVNEENKGGAGTTESTSKPSERKGDQSNGNNDSTNKNDQTDNYPRDKDTTDKGRDKGLGADTRGTDTREKGGVTDTREGTSPGNPGTSGSMSPASPTSPPSDREKGETTGEMKSDTTKTSALDAQGVIAKLHGINQFEIRLGKLALKKAKNKSVRSYGAMMIKCIGVVIKALQNASCNGLIEYKSGRLSKVPVAQVSDANKMSTLPSEFSEAKLTLLPL